MKTLLKACAITFVALGISLAAWLTVNAYLSLKNAGVQKSSVDARLQIGTKR